MDFFSFSIRNDFLPRIPRKTGTDSGTAATWERKGDSIES
jgi:hypothetical protein